MTINSVWNVQRAQANKITRNT